MSITKKCAPKFMLINNKKSARFRSFFIRKIDFECQILAPFDTSAFLAQSLANCVPLPIKRDNSYYHNQDYENTGS